MKINKKGFTLLELLVVIIILGILSSIALPQYIQTLEKARSGEAIVNVGSIRGSLDRYWYQNNFDLTGAKLPIDGTSANLDVDNPNALIERFYTYTISNLSGPNVPRSYTVIASRVKAGQNYVVLWQQINNTFGKLYRSGNLGGPEVP
jgi:prepilin-type N-terminal cleavage/methylation domain-containing protein